MDINFSKTIGSAPPKTISQSRNYMIEAVLIALVSVIFVWFVVLPKRAEVKLSSDELAKLQVKKDKVNGDYKNLQELVSIMKSEAEQIAILDKAIPLKQNQSQIEMVLGDMAKLVNVTLGNIGISSRPGVALAGDKELAANPFGVKRSLQKASGSVFVLGNFNQLLNFIKKIETSGRLISITDMEIDRATEGNLNMRLGIVMYYFAP
jgi:Tfp pilus assembly protein PilO